jgi:IS30 family transposase
MPKLTQLQKVRRNSRLQSIVPDADRGTRGAAMAGVLPRMSILYRPDAVAERKQFGHWECDLIQFRKKFGKANVTSLVERVSRFAVFLRNNDRQSRPVMDGLIQVLQSLPHLARRSITFDRGTEFTDWPYLQASIGAQTWFCDPQSPWRQIPFSNATKTIMAIFSGGWNGPLFLPAFEQAGQPAYHINQNRRCRSLRHCEVGSSA